MASTFKTFINDDVASTRTLLHESIPITGSIISGSYDEPAAATSHVKTYAHGMFQSVYDYPYQSSSANHIFDLTHGHHADFATKGVTGTKSDGAAYDQVGSLGTIGSHPFVNKRKNIYNQMAQVLVGHNVDGSIRKFDIDGDLTASDDGEHYNALIFINFARLLGKDEIKKGSFELQLGTGQGFNEANPSGGTDQHTSTITIKDEGAQTSFKVNSPAGEYGLLKVTASGGSDGTNGLDGNWTSATPATTPFVGLIYYQAGIVALSPEVFMAFNSGTNGKGILNSANCNMNAENHNVLELMNHVSKNMDKLSTALRQRMLKVCFNNTTELNSTIYFCRVNHNDFNYSSNPTYLSNSKVIVKNKSTDAPVSYITTVGLYSSENELLAVAKLSEPLRKDPTNDITLRVRLDY